MAQAIDRAAQAEPRERTSADEQPVQQQTEQPSVRARVLGLAGRGRGGQPLAAQRRGQMGAGLGPDLSADPVVGPVPHARFDDHRGQPDRAREHAVLLGPGEGAGERQDQRDGLAPGDRSVLVLAEHGRERAIGSFADQPGSRRVLAARDEATDPEPPERAQTLGRVGPRSRDPPQLAPIRTREALGVADRFERAQDRGRARHPQTVPERRLRVQGFVASHGPPQRAGPRRAFENAQIGASRSGRPSVGPPCMASASAQTLPGSPQTEADGLDTRAARLVYKSGETMPETDTERRTQAYGNDDSDAEPEPDPSPNPLSESRRIGDFLVRRLIGEGGMGKVYEAEERLSKRKVALKVLRSELSRSEAGRRAFVNEMAILARLDDPHVVRCLHCTEADGELVMALEYLEGETLRARMTRDGALAWDVVVAIAWQIAAALQAAHGAEPAIIHRDLKPENVMLLDPPEGQAGGRVKVMDFGIAKVMQAVSGNTTHSVGTLQYMSPEQIDARPLSPRSDLYALGLVMWELLAGRPPFEAESPRVLLDKLCTEPAPQLPAEARRGLPRGVEQLIHELLEKDPDSRPANAGEVLERLEPFRPAELSLASPGKGTGITAAAESNRLAVSRDTPAKPSSSGSSAVVLATPSSTTRDKRLDTVGVVERAVAPREIPTKLAASIIVSLSLAAGLVTWLIRLLAS